MYSTDLLKIMWLWSKGYITHIIIIIPSAFTFLSYLLVVVCLRWLYRHNDILSIVSYIFRESWVFASITSVQSMMRKEIGYIVVWRSYFFFCVHITLSHYHRYTDLYWAYNMLVEYILSSACLELDHLSQLSFMQYPNYPSLLWWLWKYVYFVLSSSSNRKYGSLAIVFSWLYMYYETMVCAVYLTLFVYSHGFW